MDLSREGPKQEDSLMFSPARALRLHSSYFLLPYSILTMVTSRAQQQETSKRFPSDDRILGEIWADAYAAWDFGDYRPGGPVQYIRPLAQDSEKTPLGTLHLPHPVVFEITAFNPAALSKNLPTNKTNFKMLRQLRREVQKLSSPKPAMALHSFGFDSSWREDGLMVAYAAESDRERARADMIRLGKEFGQGAIYEIRRLLEDDPELVATRTTVPCSEEFEETRAVVKITGTHAPTNFPNLIWDPLNYYSKEEFSIMLKSPPTSSTSQERVGATEL